MKTTSGLAACGICVVPTLAIVLVGGVLVFGALFTLSSLATTVGDGGNENPSNSSECYALKYTNITDEDKYAEAIDKYIRGIAPNTVWLDIQGGPGKAVIKGAKGADINPALGVCIGQHESLFCSGCHGNNSFGRMATASQPHITTNRMWYAWPSIEASLTANDNIFNYIRDVYTKGDPYSDETLAQFIHHYAPNGDGNNNETVYRNFLEDCMNKINNKAGDAISCN